MGCGSSSFNITNEAKLIEDCCKVILDEHPTVDKVKERIEKIPNRERKENRWMHTYFIYLLPNKFYMIIC
jgi:hypothetical protein